MQNFDAPQKIIITCNKWLTPYVLKEVLALGYTPKITFLTGLELWGTLNDCIILNMHLRCASQVLYSLKSFFCDNPNNLYDAVLTLPWQNIIAADGYFSVTSNVYHHTINNNLFANVRVKDAIVDVMSNANGNRPNSGNDMQGTVIHLHWKNENAEIFIDTSGESLGRHGYRKIPGKAPMLEALAAATILATNWAGQTAFVNPMCGSGTLAIEAALIATNRKPGLLRNNYSFMHILGYNHAFYTTQLQKLFDVIINKPNLKIIASDVSETAIKNTEANAAMADVNDLITYQICDFAKTTLPTNVGVVMLNPEYGLRLGDIDELEETYARIGHWFKTACKGYTGYIFTGNLALGKCLGLKPKKRIEFLNGKIDCRLFEYELYAGTKRVFEVK